MREGRVNARVVVADDSEIAASYLERLLEADPRIRVVGRASNGAELLGLPERGMAQVVVVDVLMPELSGLSVIRRLAADCAVIAVSSMDPSSVGAMEAIALGAIAFFSKRDLSKESEAHRLRELVKSAAGTLSAPAHRSVVFVVGSTGAISHLETLVGELQGHPLLIVQHLPEGKDLALAQLLTSRGARARVARHGDTLEPAAFVAPIARHMELDAQERIRLVDGPPVNGHRPSGDVLLSSAARLGSRAVGVVLSGLGSDGALGMAKLAEAGGSCFVLNSEDCHAPAMPRAALATSSRVRSVPAKDLGLRVRKAAGFERSKAD